MREIASIELGFAVNEVREKINEAFLRKFYDLGDDSFRFSFYSNGENTHVYCKLMQTFNITEVIEKAKEATPFAIGIRNRLENSRINSIAQKGSDRVIIIKIGKENYSLIIEMFGKGNMILVNAENRIELCYRSYKYKDRDIRPGALYNFSGSKTLDVQRISRDELEDILNKMEQEERVITYLSKYINIGPLYLENIILQSGIDPKSRSISEEQREKLADSIYEFLKKMGTEKPRTYIEEGETIDYAICEISKYSNLESKQFDSLSALLDSIYSIERTRVKDIEHEKMIEGTKANIERQIELLESTKKEMVEYSKAGNKILSNMHQYNEMINYARQNRRITLEELKQAFPNINITNIDLKRKTVKIELEEM